VAAYVDSCVLLSLLLGDSGYTDSERWLINQGDQTLWISHWVLLEVAGVIATCVRRGQLTAEQAQTIGSEFESFRQERLTLIEPRGTDFLQARQWLERCLHLPLRSGDALHLALAQSASNSPW
jgi:predicted nucleic acid-binding protein